MRTCCVKNGVVIVVILLFVGVAVQPSIATVQPEEEIDIEHKEYLFQTIIDIANNPEVKKLFEQYKYDLFEVKIDRSVCRKLIFRNPRLLSNTLFTKPSMSIEYLNKCYNNGIEITNILGEDKALEMIESVKVIDMKFFDALDNIISKDEKLSYRLSTIEKMNNNLKLEPPFMFRLIFCAYMISMSIALFILLILLAIPIYIIFNIPNIWDILDKFPNLFAPLFGMYAMTFLALVVCAGMSIGCFYDPWE